MYGVVITPPKSLSRPQPQPAVNFKRRIHEKMVTLAMISFTDVVWLSFFIQSLLPTMKRAHKTQESDKTEKSKEEKEPPQKKARIAKPVKVIPERLPVLPDFFEDLKVNGYQVVPKFHSF